MAKTTPKIKDFFKNKGKQYGKDLLASAKGDLNGKILGGVESLIGKNKYNSKIADGLQDLLHGTLGVRTSNVQNIEQAVRDTIERDRAERVKASIASPLRIIGVPPLRSRVLYFPEALEMDDGNYYNSLYKLRPATDNPDGTKNFDSGMEMVHFPNQIHFRSLIRNELVSPLPTEYAGRFTELDKFNTTTRSELVAQAEAAGMPLTAYFKDWLHKYRNTQALRSTESSKEVVYDVFLYLPKQLSDSVKVTYASEGVSMMEGMFARLFSSFDANDGAATEDAVGKQNPDVDEWMRFIRGMLPGGKIIQWATGNMTNPMKFQALEGVDFRTYTYKFTLRPKNREEADMIRDIIYAFKWSMLPGIAGYNAKTWTYPNEWAIRFQGPIKGWIDFPLTAVCTGCDVDYGGGANVTTFTDGAPTAMDLTLTFTETVQLSRERYAAEVAPVPHDAFDSGKYGVRDEEMVERGSDLRRYGDIKPTESGGGGWPGGDPPGTERA